jgi:2-polyprenyl-3-methyl-5-hydroxy-6-metoxy-1,4-benzoquinol methylase
MKRQYMNLKYETLEKIQVQRPVDRLDFIVACCVGKVVLDIGCFDETALVKRETKHWLHGRLAANAKSVVGIDNSSKIPSEGLRTANNSMIYRGDGVHPEESFAKRSEYDVIVAGEFIEHIPNPLEFFGEMKIKFAGRELIISTPNGVSFANTLLGVIGREVQHHDHLHNFTFKILNTLCLRSGFKSWEIIPYHFYATEMILNSHGAKRVFVKLIEHLIKLVEWFFPLLSFGYIVRIRL